MHKLIEEEPIIWIDHKIHNYEDFVEVTHSWQIDFVKLDAKPFYALLQQIIFPEIQITHTKINCHLDQKGFSPDDMWTFVIMDKDTSMFKFNHVDSLSTSTMVIFPPGGKINGISYDGFHIYTFSIKQSHFKNLTKILGLNNIEEKLYKIDRVELEPEQADSIRRQLKDIINSTSLLKHKMISSEGKKLLLHYLPVKFLQEIGKNIGCATHKMVKERDIRYMEVRAYMHTHLHQPITISGIAKKFKLSKRSLSNYFKKELNTSPKQYLIILRLNKVHLSLKQEKMKKGLVEQTARRFGFFHMGDFSKNYRNFFGELPSETLRKS